MVNSSEEKKELERNDQREVTVDDLLPVLEELQSRIQQLEAQYAVLREHEHGVDGKPVVRL